jgi:zinc/manganese transport system permease protein
MMETLELLYLPYLACLLMAAMLGYLGIHVLKREVIFIDIALAQMVAVGAIAAHMLFHVHGDSPAAYGCAFAFALLAAGFYAVVRRKVTQIPLEAVIGVSYAIAAAAALFLVGVAPGGHTHVQHMLAGSILWVEWADLGWCAAVFAAAGLGFLVLRRPFRTISDDYDGAVRDGMRVVVWDFAFYALVGLVITFAVRIAGVVLVFCFLIMPATTSALFSSRWGTRMILTWVTAGLASAAGLLFAHQLDFSIGPSVAAALGATLALSSCARALFRKGEGYTG